MLLISNTNLELFILFTVSPTATTNVQVIVVGIYMSCSCNPFGEILTFNFSPKCTHNFWAISQIYCLSIFIAILKKSSVSIQFNHIQSIRGRVKANCNCQLQLKRLHGGLGGPTHCIVCWCTDCAAQ